MKRDFIFHKVKGAERFLAALLCLVLMLSMLPASLFANASETPIATLFFRIRLSGRIGRQFYSFDYIDIDSQSGKIRRQEH